MWHASRVPKIGQMIEKPSFSQTVIKKFMALRGIGKRTIVSRQVPFHKANERRRRLPASKNRSTVKARFRHPSHTAVASQAQLGEEHELPQSAASTFRPHTLGDTEGHKVFYRYLSLLPFDRQR